MLKLGRVAYLTIPALRRQGQEDPYKYKASVVYIASSRLPQKGGGGAMEDRNTLLIKLGLMVKEKRLQLNL